MKTKYKISEAELVDQVLVGLELEGFKTLCEVPNMGQSVDIIATKSRWMWAIEAKVGNWKRAMEQCRAHEIVADYICLALDKVPNNSPILGELEKRGYGLIVLSAEGGMEWVVYPKKNQSIWPPQRKKFRERIREFSYAC